MFSFLFSSGEIRKERNKSISSTPCFRYLCCNAFVVEGGFGVIDHIRLREECITSEPCSLRLWTALSGGRGGGGVIRSPVPGGFRGYSCC